MKHRGTQAIDPMKETKTSSEEDPRYAKSAESKTMEHRKRFLKVLIFQLGEEQGKLS